jgi:thiamine biosynthesis lipoprotein
MMTKTAHHVFHSMGIPIHVTLAGFSQSDAENASQKVEKIFHEYDLRFSRFKKESELMSLNQSNSTWHKVSLPLFQVIKKCVALATETGGIFDPSIGSVLASYGYGLPENFILPATPPTYRDISFNDRELQILLAPGQILEPACIIKGMAIDAAGASIAEVLRAPNQGFMINAGGDILTKGDFEKGAPWNVAIQAPDNPTAIVTAVVLKNAGMATSGAYETKGEQDGKKWHHLINMETRKPASEVTSATVIAETCEQADTEASLAILLPLDLAVTRLDQKNLPYFLINHDGQIIKNAAFTALEIPLKNLSTL